MKAKVFVIKTSPGKIINDYRLIVRKTWAKVKKQAVVIKLNLSWTKFYPACSSPPWQLEGVIKGLLDLGFSPKQIVPVENRTVVTDVYRGAKNHYWGKVCRGYGVKLHYLTKELYVQYRPKAKMLALNKIFPFPMHSKNSCLYQDHRSNQKLFWHAQHSPSLGSSIY